MDQVSDLLCDVENYRLVFSGDGVIFESILSDDVDAADELLNAVVRAKFLSFHCAFGERFERVVAASDDDDGSPHLGRAAFVFDRACHAVAYVEQGL